MTKKKESIKKVEEKKEPANLLELYVKPHKKVSREVTEADVEKVKALVPIIAKLCNMPHGVHPGAIAISHAQIDDKDPMRFYVTYDGFVVINPVIANHTKFLLQMDEGCTSFPNKGNKRVGRYRKIELDFQTLVGSSEDKDKMTLSMVKHVDLKKVHAQLAQHEIGHMDGNCIYDPSEYKA